MSTQRYYTLNTYFRARHQCRIQKIPLDAQGTCPNRDGTLSSKGCTFCNAQGSGTGLGAEGLSLQAQYLRWREKYLARGQQAKFLAYFQSFTNTYGPAHKLQKLLRELNGLPDLAGLALGTRPDCLDQEKLQLLAQAPWPEAWLDLGLQSANDQTLCRIRRGHDSACFAQWSKAAGDLGIKVCVHVITGLPEEELADFEQTILFVNSLPVSGIKIHNLLICRGAAMADQWHAGSLTLLSKEESVAWVVRGISLLRPDIVVHRVNADPAGDELLAPAWAADKTSLLNAIRTQLDEENIWQGKALGHGRPEYPVNFVENS